MLTDDIHVLKMGAIRRLTVTEHADSVRISIAKINQSYGETTHGSFNRITRLRTHPFQFASFASKFR